MRRPHKHHHHLPTIPRLILSSLLTTTLLILLPTTASATVIVTITETATATATTTTTATPEVPQDPSYTSSALFESSILKTTNAWRTAYNASSLVWNNTLATFANKWAEKCMWEHSGGPYGENLAFGYANASSAVRAWGVEVSMYDFKKPTGFSEETGHFTQLVWKGTREVGCAAVNCGLTDLDGDDGDGRWTRPQGWYVVCEYIPGGNVIGAGDDLKYFRLNVQDRGGKVYDNR
ncbi:CAP domain-containing protein [Aspergillus varians]